VTKDYGEVLNTIKGVRCPKCGRSASMTVHAEDRVYHPCGHHYDLPPIGVTSCYGRERRTASSEGANR
jgi:ribosomal protein S27AE